MSTEAQIEGLCLAVASLSALLRRKGLVTDDEIDVALARAEVAARAASPSAEGEATALVPKLLRVANRQPGTPSFAALAESSPEPERHVTGDDAWEAEGELFREAQEMERQRDA